MNSPNSLSNPSQDSWASAFVDGEVNLCEQESLSETVREQLYYYTVARQVLRGEHSGHTRLDSFQIQQRTWVRFWTRIDSV